MSLVNPNLSEMLKAKQKKEKVRHGNMFEGICISMNKNVSHTKSFRKTQKALMKV